MDPQNIFYLFAIIYLSLGIVFMIVCIAVIWKVVDTVRTLPKTVEEKIAGIVESKAAVFISSVGIPLLSLFVNKMKDRYKKKNTKE